MQVKIEDQAEYSGVNADAERLRDAAWDPPPTRVKEEVTCSLTSDDDSDTILGYLLSYPALQKSASESSYSLGSLFDSDNEENISLLEPRNQDIKPDPDSFLEKRSYLLRTMNFSQQEVDFTLNELGEKAPLEQLVDHIINAQSEGSSRQNENDDATSEGKVQSLFSVMDRSVGLLHMGFTEEEVSWAIGNFGQEATITDLADHIFARRISNSIEQKEVKVESDFLDETETEFSTYRTSCFGVNYEDDDGYGRDHTRVKRAKTIFVDDREASSSLHNPIIQEFLNSQFFSALTRNEGYLHNLPMERRHAVVPKSPMTIEEALPFTRQWWPSWDTRKHISVVSIEAAGIEQTCERLGRMARESRVVLSHDRQMHIVHQCKASNLVWVGQDKLSPLEPRQVERILGYPNNHTDLFGLSQQERFAALKFAFQTDTLAYLLSVLKDKYPSGMRVLSIYSGIGGAEVTLHRLGIRLKCVVSVEQSDINRKILRRWWGKTEQKGELRQYPGIGTINTTKIENLIAEFGGFDLIIGGNYNSYRGGTTINATMGLDAQHFYEYARVVKSFRSAVGLH
ncbi:hypothetical protein PR202_ga11157 [Eleusine coracana subsp. coracana]|uniref:SAM-dependent MTase DRM-type domain-containing protein n=1 Tax=Eleusine coracana subsp. coracana TaxID=191504 RepID=A0AAV5C8Y3_ELECO|nr:hypothetical protein PR202_ga11157 [Eleusine coracana subsp. coracana]